MAGQTGRHGARGVKVNSDEVLQVLTDSQQLAVVDTVGYVCQLETFAKHFTHFEVFEDNLCWLAEKGLTLCKNNHQIVHAQEQLVSHCSFCNTKPIARNVMLVGTVGAV